LSLKKNLFLLQWVIVNQKNMIDWHNGCSCDTTERPTKEEEMRKVIEIFLQTHGWKGSASPIMKPQSLIRLVFAVWAGAIFTWLAAIPALAQTRQEQAELKSVVGEVEVLRRGTTTWQAASAGMLLSAGDEIRAAQDSAAELAMVDGSVVMVFARSRLQIRQLTTEVATQKRTSFFHLVVGVVRYIVAKPAATLVGTRENVNVFSISTPTAVMAARGTDGIISYYPSQE
jgi:hypothetical protein